ncbi:MAG: GDP-mannose 4,6-dehydratase [Planctomycetota bacterium]
MTSPATFLVIGSNSFTGSHFVETLLEAGHEVLATSRSAEPGPVFLPYRWPELAGARTGRLEVRRLDLNEDRAAILALVHERRPEYVVNFAAQSMVAQSWDSPVDWFRTNTLATVALHEELRRCSFLRRYVHVSTPEVYGSCQGLVREDAPLNPSTPYAVSRAAADMSLRTFHARWGFPVVTTRAANVFGPGQQLYRIVPRAILCALTKQKLKLDGGGRSVRSFIHVRDVTEATLHLALEGQTGEVYHLSTDRHHTIRQVVEEACRQTGASFEETVEVVGDRPGKDQAYLLDSAKARALGWQPRRTFEEGVAETIRWMRGSLDAILREPADYVHKP